MPVLRTRREFVRDLGIGAAAVPFVLNLPSLRFLQEYQEAIQQGEVPAKAWLVFTHHGEPQQLAPGETVRLPVPPLTPPPSARQPLGRQPQRRHPRPTQR